MYSKANYEVSLVSDFDIDRSNIGLVPKFSYGFNFGIVWLDVLSFFVCRSQNNTLAMCLL